MRLDDGLEPLEVVDERARVIVEGATVREIPVDGLAVGDIGPERDEPRVVRLIAQRPSPWQVGAGRG